VVGSSSSAMTRLSIRACSLVPSSDLRPVTCEGVSDSDLIWFVSSRAVEKGVAKDTVGPINNISPQREGKKTWDKVGKADATLQH
jgi:hypothetical protein